jgi:hypothetical protein
MISFCRNAGRIVPEETHEWAHMFDAVFQFVCWHGGGRDGVLEDDFGCYPLIEKVISLTGGGNNARVMTLAINSTFHEWRSQNGMLNPSTQPSL